MVEHMRFFLYGRLATIYYFFDVCHVKWANPVLAARGFIKKIWSPKPCTFTSTPAEGAEHLVDAWP